MCIYIYLELFVLYGDAVYFCCHYNPSLSNTKGLFYLNMLMLQAFMWSRDATSLLTGGGGVWLVLSRRQAAYIHCGRKWCLGGGVQGKNSRLNKVWAVRLRLQPADSEQPNESSSSPKSVSTNRTCGENISGCNSTTFLLLRLFPAVEFCWIDTL